MNFRKVSKKIRSISNVAKITRAMQMVSAVKMRRSQQAAIAARPYTQKLEEVLSRLLAAGSLTLSEIPYLKPQSGGKTLIILVTSNKGLCGGFNFNLFKFIIKSQELENCDFIAVGNKGAHFASRTARQIADFATEPLIDNAGAIFASAREAYFSGQYSQVKLVYNRYLSAMSFTPYEESFLPVNNVVDLTGESISETTTAYTIEPLSEAMMISVIEDLLTQKIRSAILDSQAAEHSARMMAMKAATDNAVELIGNLTLYRNKLRQASITSELLEMTAAQESTAEKNF